MVFISWRLPDDPGGITCMCDLVHDVETIFHLSYVLTASGNAVKLQIASSHIATTKQ